MFDRLLAHREGRNEEELRWELASDDRPQLAMFGHDVTRKVGRGEYRGLEFLEVRAKSVINQIPAAAMLPFRYTINAYRGCSHACTYCFARPTHEYLGLDAGVDFEQKIVVKVNAAEVVRRETAPQRWAGEPIAMGTNTDPYQPAEGKYRLTRAIVEVLAERANPFSILTKSPLVLRDLELLTEAARSTSVFVDFSIGTLDEAVWKASEPGTPHPRKRMEAVAKLNAAGIPSGVLMGPVLPGLSDSPEQIEEVVMAAVDAGARYVSPILLHLRKGVREQYLGWLAEARPDLIGLHQRMYRVPGYAKQSQREALSSLVRDLVERHGGNVRARETEKPAESVERAALPPPTYHQITQLSLGV